MTATTEENKAVVRRLYDEIDEHYSDVFDELFAEECTTGIFRSGSEEAIDGPEGIRIRLSRETSIQCCIHLLEKRLA